MGRDAGQAVEELRRTRGIVERLAYLVAREGFYLAVATLAAQFFLSWLFNKVGWFYNYNPSGTITAPPREILGIMVTGPEATAETRYYVALVVVTVMALVAKNLVRGRLGRSWMAIRDMDIAAEIIGIRPFQTKLLAFAISSFYCGVAGAMMVFLFYYIYFLGRHSLVTTLAIAIGMPVVLFFFFDVAMRIVLPKGYLEPLFIPLYDIFL